ncbi:MarR family transcriptional regulator [Flavipsychrobacter stenotrophus]|uniref:MarR family transcriptional regulator n=1 Tax=Flavipsychrobacter stenotrophus TaxID=2077091 RepID=A0A2S7T2T4_9BACT|nr:MarR family transcriptional regulator [Flavipsychrobacter stenotrophus]PQJ13066.1 MarR family transcriptional regulator [Flavipsychrobacter stenotrophus]
MSAQNRTLSIILALAKLQTVVTRKFDANLSVHGLSFNDFIILHYLSNAPGNKLRRIDLAEQMGITASGITRTLAPLEKRGLVGREANEHDARVSYVVLAPAGEELYNVSMKAAMYAANAVLPVSKTKKIVQLEELLLEILSVS